MPTLRQKKGTREACSYLLCPRCDGIEAQEGVRRIGKSKDSDLCASAHRCPHYAYARLIARVTFNLFLFRAQIFQHFIRYIQLPPAGSEVDLWLVGAVEVGAAADLQVVFGGKPPDLAFLGGIVATILSL